MVKIEIDAKQLERAIHNLPREDRERLLKQLMKDAWEERLLKLRERVRRRVNKYPIKQKDINRIVEEAKNEYHAKSRR